MRLLSATDPAAFAAALDREERFDYVYMYPPRQAYRRFPDVDAAEAQSRSALAEADRLNLYFHVPFCRQICSYCNLYAVASRDGSAEHRRYVETVIAELRQRAATTTAGAAIRTFYVGGGTPSLLDAALVKSLLGAAEDSFGFSVADIAEVAIEVSPDTASEDHLRALQAAGINRINLGIQTSNAVELEGTGRRYGTPSAATALEAAMSAGFDNVCADLIFGLPGQSFSSWADSVRFVMSFRPETICAYGLTLRSGTGFGRRGVAEAEGAAQYKKWDFVNEALLGAGYERQTHVRWALPGRGGYLQKAYHWASEPLLGFGAGARSYLPGIDVRNGYSLGRRRRALDEYMGAVAAGRSALTDGFLMSDDEQRRKAVVLGLGSLDIGGFTARFGVAPQDAFPCEFEMLAEFGLVEESTETLRLTERGVRHRDLAVQPFVSNEVRELALSFDYRE